jgi:hypothetical protein
MASISDTRRYVSPVAADRDNELARVRTLARVLDRYFVDPILGLVIPGGGDILGSILGVYMVMIAARRKVSPVIIARMLMNLAADAVLGFIPFIGDLFDFGFKANTRNLQLLEEASVHGGRATAKDWAMVVGAALTFVAVLALIVWGIVALFRRVF